MKIAILQHTRFNFLDKLNSLLERKGFHTISVDYAAGTLQAEKKLGLFGKNATVLIRTVDMGGNEGEHVEIIVNGNERKYDTPLDKFEELEEKLLDLVYEHF